jgi:hypothetical protein
MLWSYLFNDIHFSTISYFAVHGKKKLQDVSAKACLFTSCWWCMVSALCMNKDQLYLP